MVPFPDRQAVASGPEHLERGNWRKLLVLPPHSAGNPNRGGSIVLIRGIVEHELRWVTADYVQHRVEVCVGPDTDCCVVEPERIGPAPQKIQLSVVWKCEDRVAGLSFAIAQPNQ